MKATAVIVGSGNLGTDLPSKLMRYKRLEPRPMIDSDRASASPSRARELRLAASAKGVDWALAQDALPDRRLDATCGQSR